MLHQDNQPVRSDPCSAQFLKAKSPFVPYSMFKAALLLSGMALGIQVGVASFRDSPVPRSSLAPVQNAPSREAGKKAAGLRQYEYLAQHYNENAFCRTEVRALAQKYFSSNDQLKDSLASHLAKTYKIAPKYAGEIVRTAAKASKDHDVDPFLILGIIAKESSFNHTARSGYGATGLMQVHAPSHRTLLKAMGLKVDNLKMAEKSLRSEIRVNVMAGIQIYKQYEKQYGSRAKALQAYNGAKNDATLKYAKNVLALRDAFSVQAAAPIGCNKAGYAFIEHGEQKLELMAQKPNPA
jgi:soluble lytic murein transglycosylase-like protein